MKFLRYLILAHSFRNSRTSRAVSVSQTQVQATGYAKLCTRTRTSLRGPIIQYRKIIAAYPAGVAVIQQPQLPLLLLPSFPCGTLHINSIR